MNFVPITDVCNFQGGTQPPKSEWSNKPLDGYVRMLQIRDFTQIEKNEAEYVKDTNKLKKCQEDDILIGRYGASVGKILTGLAGAYNVAIVKTIPDEKKLRREFLYYLLKGPIFQNFILNVGGRAAQAGFNKTDLEKFIIPLPSLDDQKRIAHLLGKVEGLIARRKQHLQQLDDLLKSVFLEMFGDPVRNEKGWNIESLGSLAVIERGRFSPRPRNDPKFYNGPYPFIQTGDINRSNGRLKEFTQTLNELGIKVSKEFNVGTIVIAIVGATIGETAILQIPTYAPDSVIGITPKSGAGEKESVFIEFLLRFWKPVLRAKAPEAARANINIETLRPLPIVWPPENDREKFAIIVEKVEDLKACYHQSLTDLESLYGALSQKAFRGELDLSRVALPAELPDKFEKELSQPETAADDNSDMMHRFSTLDTPGMSVKDARRSLLQQWFDEWVGDTAVDEELSPERFWQRARFSALDHRDEDDETEDFTAEDYDIFKEKLFSAIEGGLISQTRNTVEVGGEAEFGNRIILKKAG
jgi:type I restriction enzyme S subunit